MGDRLQGVRRAQAGDALEVARLLHDFNGEFDTASPGVVVLGPRLERLLAAADLLALLASGPDEAVAVLSLRPNPWYDGPVALLDELYVRPALRGRGIGGVLLIAAQELARTRGAELLEINVDEPDAGARRFYEAHGFSAIDPDSGERALYYSRELGRD